MDMCLFGNTVWLWILPHLSISIYCWGSLLESVGPRNSIRDPNRNTDSICVCISDWVSAYVVMWLCIGWFWCIWIYSTCAVMVLSSPHFALWCLLLILYRALAQSCGTIIDFGLQRLTWWFIVPVLLYMLMKILYSFFYILYILEWVVINYQGVDDWDDISSPP